MRILRFRTKSILIISVIVLSIIGGGFIYYVYAYGNPSKPNLVIKDVTASNIPISQYSQLGTNVTPAKIIFQLNVSLQITFYHIQTVSPGISLCSNFGINLINVTDWEIPIFYGIFHCPFIPAHQTFNPGTYDYNIYPYIIPTNYNFTVIYPFSINITAFLDQINVQSNPYTVNIN